MPCSDKFRPIPSFTASHHQNESSGKFLKVSAGEYRYFFFVHNNDFAITLFPRKGVGVSREWSIERTFPFVESLRNVSEKVG